MRCRRSLLLASGCCRCCHRCCQPRPGTRRILARQPVEPSRGEAGHASEHWRELFGKLAAHGMQGSRAEAGEREDRTWVIVWLSPTRLDFHPEPTLDAASALIGQVNGAEQEWQSGAAQIEAAVRSW
jgi:hypothetical protein